MTEAEDRWGPEGGRRWGEGSFRGVGGGGWERGWSGFVVSEDPHVSEEGIGDGDGGTAVKGRLHGYILLLERGK